MNVEPVKLLDCTLRDGGYYNAWDFDRGLIDAYLNSMVAIAVDYVELGFRGFAKNGFRGGCAYTTDSFIRSLDVPKQLNLGVMVNASEIVSFPNGIEAALAELFVPETDSPISLVRIACHFYEFEAALQGCSWLKEQGYLVGINLMQVADRSLEDIERLAKLASDYPLDVLYFADSMGSMSPQQTSEIIEVFRAGWQGALGIHTHDNMGRAIMNSLQAIQNGVSWIDSTVTGMGRGAGNVQTEYLAIELAPIRSSRPFSITPLMEVIRQHFAPLKQEHGWGTNSYYYLAGMYGIHPTYIQEMLTDARYAGEDILAVINHLKLSGGKKFNLNALEAARHFYFGEPKGSWSPASIIEGRDVLILGTGPGVAVHQQALEDYIRGKHPVVIALNTQSYLDSELIDLRAACHPVRLLADYAEHARLPQPLVTPASMLPETICDGLAEKKLLDFGLTVQPESFEFSENYCVLPTSMVIAYALAIAASGRASKIMLAGFDGYKAGDPRNQEMDTLISNFMKTADVPPVQAVTPTRYAIPTTSIYIC